MQRSICLDVCDYTDTPLCNLYDSTNDLSGQATDVIVHMERNGFKEIKFNIPSVCADGERNYRLDYLITDYKLRLYTNFNDPENAEIDWFLISEPRVTHNIFSQNYEIRASHISNLLNTKNLSLEFSDEEGNNTGTIEQIAATILDGTGWHLGQIAKFYEENKYVQQGVKKEKVRSFTASAKTGAFKMMSNLCELFDAKPIYHGAGKYEEDGIEKIGRTVDILPLNPFSDKLEDGQIPEEVLNGCNVLELYYDKNVKSISRTANSDNLVTVFSAYGSYGDENGIVSLQTCSHDEITFGTLQAGTYCFEYFEARYFFTTDKETTGLKWSYLDPMSRTYVFNGTDLYKVTTDIPVSYTTITGTIESVKNQVSFIMDFSYYQKIGLLTDEMILEIAKFQWSLPEQYIIAQENSLGLLDTLSELSSTASAGNGFLMLDISESSTTTEGYVKLHLNKSTYSDGVIFRSDYDEARRNYFTWNTASSIKESGQSIDGKGAVVYIVHQGNPTTWEKAYVKAYGNSTDDYYRDSLGNTYELHIKEFYDHKEYDPSDPSGSYFPLSGQKNIIYITNDTKKMYVWFNGSYIEIKTSGYSYGLNEFEHPDYITLWISNDTWYSGDKVYMFSADSIAGLYGPREDQVSSNSQSIEVALKNGTTESHPIVFLNENDSTPLPSICTTGYGWYYRSYKNTFSFGDLYFCYGKDGEIDWSRVYVSNESNNPETIQPISGFNYYYSLKKMLVYRIENGKYVALNRTTDEKAITAAFEAVVEGCYKQEMLTKGVKERYNYNDSLTELQGNYAFRNEYDNYYLFSTGTRIVSNPSLVYYDSSSRMVWLDQDEEHIVNSSEYSFRYLNFPKVNELFEVTFALMDGKQTSSNITVHDNTEYEFVLPANSTIICKDENNTVLSEVTASPFVTPNHTTKVVITSTTVPTNQHYLRVVNYDKTLFVKNVGYRILNSVGAGERTGLSYLMDKFIDLAYEAYEVRLPALQQAQKTITDSIKDMSEYLGDMYREGFWQETSYVEGDEDKLYSDALENFREISHPQYTYEVSFLDTYGSDDNLGAEIKIEYPDVDITYAAHLVDTDIDTNKWAYIDSIDKCYDQSWKTQLEINTQLSTIGQQSFTDVLGKIAEVANQVKAKQTVYDRAESINSAGQVAADKLEGLINANKVYLLGGTSNWYTDDKGNITFESADGQSAMMLTGRGLMVSNSKDQYGDWLWRTAISGLGINADTIASGEFSAKHITAGSITVDKLAANVGQELEIGSNKSLTMYATVDGSRPAGALTTMHPNEGDSWIQISAKDETNPASIDIQSGGKVHINGTSSVDIESEGSLNLNGGTMNLTSNGKMVVNGGSVDIKSNGTFTISSSNFNISRNAQDSSKYDVSISGNITVTGGKIAGYTVDQTTSGSTIIDYMYAGQTTSVDSTSAGVYLGTNGFNLGGKFVYKPSDESLNIKASNLLIGQENSTYIKLEKNKLSMNASADITISSNSTIGITTNQTVNLGNSNSPFIIGSDKKGGENKDQDRSFIYNGLTGIKDTTNNGVYVGTDGIALGQGKFKVTKEGALTATSATIQGSITAGSFNNGNDTFYVTSDGYMFAKSGSIAGWTISATSLIGNKTGIAKTSAADNIAFWAGNTTASSAPFRVRQDGKTICTDIEISGGTITIKDGTTTKFSVTNKGVVTCEDITAKGGYIGTSGDGFKINSSYIANPSTKTSYDSNVEGVYIGKTGIGLGANKFTVSKSGHVNASDISITGGEITIKNGNTVNFNVTNQGILTANSATISGAITATSGKIGSWFIGSNWIGNSGLTYGACTIGLKADATGSELAFWSGANLSTAAKDIPFYVTASGSMQATNGKIGGWFIGSNWIGNNASTYGYCTIGLRSDATGEDIAIWAGHDFTATPPFTVLADGTVIITQLRVLNPDTGQTENVNLYRNFTPASSVKVTSWSYTKSWQSQHLLLVNVTVGLSNGKTATHTFEIST